MFQSQSQTQGFLPFPGLPPLIPAFVDCGGSNTFVGIPGPEGPQGPPGPQGSAGIPGLVPVTLATTTPYLADLTDYYLAINAAEPVSLVLPISPTGTVFVIKDASGAANTNTITITASTTIDGVASALINTPYGSLTFIFNGTEWNIV